MYQLTQHKFWGVLALIISIMFVAFMVTGCGGGNDDDDDDNNDDNNNDDAAPEGPPPATSVQATPAPGGGEIPSNTKFTLKLDAGVDAVTVNGAAATGSGDTWEASPTLQEGPGQSLNVAWTNRDGSQGSAAVGPYNVKDADTTAPTITAGTVADAAADVDPAPINAGGFRFDFDENVTGTVTLTDEAGANLNWIATVQGATATLTAVAGQELANETTYKVEIKVQDAAGNPLDTTLTFVTKPKE
ncbi:hypothetical protein C6502_21100 [Candidatus Poribacteria bacterium]|nr:MAG: hypothetical protein C6502_21100 [Candidatus Poribacteria bacterium]